jgi:hypothetical protein
MIGDNLLVTTPLVMCIDTLDHKTIATMQNKGIWITEYAWYMCKPNINDILNSILLHGKSLQNDATPLCMEAHTNRLHWLVNHHKGCGKWIDTLRGCPFSSAAGLATTTMTVNENRIIELWKRMCPLYNALM